MFTGLAEAKVAPTLPIGHTRVRARARVRVRAPARARVRACVFVCVRARVCMCARVSEVEVAKFSVEGVRRVLRERFL